MTLRKAVEIVLLSVVKLRHNGIKKVNGIIMKCIAILELLKVVTVINFMVS